MKKTLIISTLATISIVGYSQIIAAPTTTQTQDSIALAQGMVASLDATYQSQTNLAYLRYQQQRNNLLRQIEKLQTNSNSTPVITTSPASQTPSN